jgi:3alpha(or 20beta)-hydroxysteroid dehydrogenase
MAGRLQGKVALISGGAEGLGAAMAAAFVREGAQVMLGDIQVEKTAATAAKLGALAAALTLDVTNEAQWQAAVDATVARFGKLNILVNNAGISEPASIEDATTDHWRRVMDINLDGTFFGCRAALSAMKASGEPGSIINISSMLALRPGGIFTAYCASKAAVTILTKCVALHCAASGYPVRANTIHPGAIETPMLDRYVEATGLPRDEAYQSFAVNHPMGRCGKPEEIANAAVFLASDESSFTTGTELTVDGGGWFRD